MTIELTPDAKLRFEQYLQRMRDTMRGARAVEAAEVEQNVREHVEVALATAPAPVGSDRLAAVLEQLGPPEQWLPEEDRPAWRRTMERLMTGPEDWRLPYLSFAVTTLMFVTLPIGGALLLLPAFVLSRAWVALMAERGEAIDARRWLVLPPIAIAFVLFLGLTLAGGIILAGAAALEHDVPQLGIRGPEVNAEELLAFSGYLMSAAGVWWLFLSILFAFLMQPIRTLFAPLLENVGRRHLLVLGGAAVFLLAVGLALMSAAVR
ncbi:MAG TPA: hypothetical protein VHL59_02435 [Thermoanaerobaculia bacterium]|nr:hypothetical protein [Thermoanaerobaculia bacterium]